MCGLLCSEGKNTRAFHRPFVLLCSSVPSIALWVLLLFLLLAQATVGTLVICYVFSYPGKIKKTTRQKKTKQDKKDKKDKKDKEKRQKESFILWSQDSLHFSDVFSGVFLIAHGLCSKVPFFAQLFNPCLQ